MTNTITLAEVKSSTIKSATYRPQNQTMLVTFKNGSTYRYSKVPNKVFIGLYEAKSKGKYLNEKIKDKYSYRKVSA